jgi:hypothetical protein
LEAARDIYRQRAGIIQDAILYTSPLEPYDSVQLKNGKWEEKNTLDLVWQRAIRVVRSRSTIKEGLKDIPDFAILAILAIRQAVNVLSEIVDDRKSESDRSVWEGTLVASSLLSRAQLLEGDWQYDKLVKRIREHIPGRRREEINLPDIAALEEAEREIITIFKAVKAVGFSVVLVDPEPKWKKAALEEFDKNAPFKFIRRPDLEDDKVYSLAGSNERRDFIAAILQKVARRVWGRSFIPAYRLYQEVRKKKPKHSR